MNDSAPTVSIGLAVNNGEPFLEGALQSILLQSFCDFELIIADNASTDATEQICRSYSVRDRRIRYIRHEANLGARRNQEYVRQVARGRYFKYAGHNDRIAPDFLRLCVEVLEQDPQVVLCFSKIIIINEAEEVLLQPDDRMQFGGRTAHERLRNYFACPRVSQTLYGLVRSGPMKRARPGSWYGTDRAQLQELALYGGFCVLDEPLFFFRSYEGRSWFAEDRDAWFDPASAGQVVPGYWLHLYSSLQMLNRAPLSPMERIRCVWEFYRQGSDRWSTWAPILSNELKGVLSQKLKRVGGKAD